MMCKGMEMVMAIAAVVEIFKKYDTSFEMVETENSIGAKSPKFAAMSAADVMTLQTLGLVRDGDAWSLKNEPS